MKAYLVSIVVSLMLLLPGTTYADGMFGEGGWHHMRGGGFFMWLFWVIIVGVIIYFVLNHSKQQSSNTRETPMDILLKRYAKGEISREEFEQMKEDLQH